MTFLDLPTEVILDIIPHLDYTSFQNLTQTNSFLRSLRTDAFIRDAMLKSEITEKETFERYWVLPCYCCLRARVKCEFTDMHPRSKYRLGGPKRGDRRCRKCDGERGATYWERVGHETALLKAQDVKLEDDRMMSATR
jgi:hypothetical protein